MLTQARGETIDQWNARKESILTEAQNLKAAEHRNVVRVLNLVRAPDNMLHLVAEYCDGGSLLSRYEDGPLPLSSVRSIITDVCLGLSVLHDRGMIHRDIKPGNILRSGETYKLADFGLVTDDTHLGYAQMAGYADHLAPEVYAKRRTSSRSDIWALGI